MESLDTILSGRGEGVPQPNSQQEKQPVEASQQPAPVDPKSASPEEQDAPETQVNGQSMVPKAALDEARGKVKRYTEQVADFERQLREQGTAMERRIGELAQRMQPPQQQQEPDWFDNPNAAAIQAVAPHLDQLQQSLMHNSRLVATSIYTPKDVDEAEKAFMTAAQSRQLEPADYHRVVNSPNRYASAVEWHRQKTALAEIGDDPAAFRLKVEAEVLEKYGLNPGGNGQQAQQPARVMPSNFAAARNVGNRSGPVWSGPQPVDNIFATHRVPRK